MLFQELPVEISSDIGNFCARADLVNLAIACPNVFGAFIPGIYQCIVVDSIPRAIHGLAPFKQICLDFECKIICVSTVYTIIGLKWLLDTLCAHPDNAAMVRRFTVHRKFGMSDAALLTRFTKVMKYLTGLVDFE